MRVQLDTPNPAIPQDQLDKMDTNNTLALQKVINKTGVNSTGFVENSTQTTFTNTTYATPLNMRTVVTSSGGFFFIDFKTSAFITAGNNLFFQLFIDGLLAINVKDSAALTGTANTGGFVKLEWRGKLGEGRHTIEVQTKVDGGTATLSVDSTITRLQVVEVVL